MAKLSSTLHPGNTVEVIPWSHNLSGGADAGTTALTVNSSTRLVTLQDDVLRYPPSFTLDLFAPPVLREQ